MIAIEVCSCCNHDEHGMDECSECQEPSVLAGNYVNKPIVKDLKLFIDYLKNEYHGSRWQYLGSTGSEERQRAIRVDIWVKSL